MKPFRLQFTLNGFLGLLKFYIFIPIGRFSSLTYSPGRTIVTWSAMKLPVGIRSLAGLLIKGALCHGIVPSLLPLSLHLPRKLHNLPAQFHEVDGTLLQLVEQHHRLFLRKVDAQLFNDLIVVRAYAAELDMEIRQLGVVVQHRLVHFQHLELLTEEVRLEEDGFRVHVRFLVHRQKPVPFHIIEAYHHAVRLRVQLGISPVLALLFHTSYFFNFMACPLFNL